jgi:hypothetical protein
MESGDPLADELLTINSIYADAFTLIDGGTSGSQICTLQFPSLPQIVLRLEFPKDYPDELPIILGTESVGAEVPKGAGKELVERARKLLEEVYRGDVVVFDLIESMERQQMELEESRQAGGQSLHLEESDKVEDAVEEEPPWTILPARTERKSIFIAHCAPVSSPQQAKAYIRHLLTTDKKVAKASHNMSAYRIRGTGTASYQDCDDDGETAAGSRMLHLMQLMDVWDVVVVVSRWFGGVHLGPDRFRIINNAARDVLVAGGYVKEVGGKKK